MKAGENMAFNPEAYNLSDRYVRQAPNNEPDEIDDECFIYWGVKTSGAHTMQLKVNQNVAIRIHELFDRIDYDFSRFDGSVYLWKGTTSSVSPNPISTGAKAVISMDAAADDYRDFMGLFDRLYVEPLFFGDHVIFRPLRREYKMKEGETCEQK